MIKFKLKPKQFWWLVGISFLLALLLGTFATWLDLWENFSGLFRSDVGTNWLMLWETFSSWIWPLWALFAVLGYVGLVLVRMVKG